MIKNPFCKCLHPKKIVNPYINESMVVPCGHCQACTLAKNSRYAFQCDLESYTAKHTLFITLTYANRYIPRATFVDSLERPFGNDLVDKETGEILGPSDMKQEDIDRLLNKFYLFGDVPYLRKTDLQLFFKRLRYYVSKQCPSEKVRYFAVGEYGPVHFRPHYHILLFLQSDEALQVCSENLSQAWSFGRVDCQIKVSVHHTLRAMLIAVALYPKFLNLVPSVRSTFILRNWVKAFLTVNVRKYTHLPLRALLKEASYSMESIRNLTYGGRVTLTTFPDVKDLLLNLHVNVLTLTEFMIQRGVYSRPQKRRSRLRKK